MPASQNAATTPSKRTGLGAIDCARRGQSFATAFAVIEAGLARRCWAVVVAFRVCQGYLVLVVRKLSVIIVRLRVRGTCAE